MSTRSNVIIKDTLHKTRVLYHHFDGYLDGVGKEVKNYIKCFILSEFPHTSGEFMLYIMDEDPSYEMAEYVAGDAEYVYLVELQDKIIYTAYERPNWDTQYDNWRSWKIVEHLEFEYNNG